MGYRSDILAYRGIRPDLARLLANAGNDPENPGTTYYVDAYDGAAGNDGLSWSRPILTMATALTKVKSGDTICFRGKVLEQVTTPVQVFDVTIIGAATRPRHADAAPADPSGRSHGASWGPPGSPAATTPLVKVLQQGWRFVNILFDPPSDAAAVQLFRDGGAGNSERDASHASFIGCRFVGGAKGLEDSGGCGHVLVDDCEFHDLTTGISSVAGAGIGQPLLRSTIRRCRFRSNTNHLVSGAQELSVEANMFGKFTTKSIDLSGGVGSNVVWANALYGTYSNVGGYTAGTADEWGGNWNSLSGGVTASDPA